MASVFEKFSKEVLISFILQTGTGFRYKDEKAVLRTLLFIEWEQKSLFAQAMMESAIEDQKKASYPSAEWWAAQKKFDKANSLHQKAQKLYDSIYS